MDYPVSGPIVTPCLEYIEIEIEIGIGIEKIWHCYAEGERQTDTV